MCYKYNQCSGTCTGTYRVPGTTVVEVGVHVEVEVEDPKRVVVYLYECGVPGTRYSVLCSLGFDFSFS